MQFYSISGKALGTYVRVTYEGVEDYGEDIFALLDSFENSLSTYRENSTISKFNRSERGEITDSLLREVFRKAEVIHRESYGAFDASIAPLVNLWGFGFAGEVSEADSVKVSLTKEVTGMEKFVLSEDSLLKSCAGAMLDFNAIAKGYSVDVVMAFLVSKGCKNALVEIGGECKTVGKSPSDKEWRIGIEQPEENLGYGEALETVISISGKAVATSGNYRRFFERDGKKFAHTISPHSGYPVVHNLLSTTILADDCITADAYATACMVLGIDSAKIMLREHPELDAFLIFDDGGYKIYTTAGFEKYILK